MTWLMGFRSKFMTDRFDIVADEVMSTGNCLASGINWQSPGDCAGEWKPAISMRNQI